MPRSVRGKPVHPLSTIVFPLVSALATLVPSTSVVSTLVFSIGGDLITVGIRLYTASRCFVFPRTAFYLKISISASMYRQVRECDELSWDAVSWGYYPYLPSEWSASTSRAHVHVHTPLSPLSPFKTGLAYPILIAGNVSPPCSLIIVIRTALPPTY